MKAAAICGLAMIAAFSARAADLDAGKAVFNRCKICHTVAAGAKSTVGPNLQGVFGRKAGSLDEFRYSAAMKESGITWDETTLAGFLGDPKGYLPGNRMAFPGIADPGELENLLAYLRDAVQ